MKIKQTKSLLAYLNKEVSEYQEWQRICQPRCVSWYCYDAAIVTLLDVIKRIKNEKQKPILLQKAK